MQHQFENFNKLISKAKAIGVIECIDSDNEVNSAITPKESTELFIKQLEAIINESKDCTCEIISAESCDFGYAVEFTAKIVQDGEEFEEEFIIKYTSLY